MKKFKIMAFRTINSLFVPNTARILLRCKVPAKIVFKFTISKRLLVPANRINPIRNRVPTFEFAISALSRISEPLIVETGCSRKYHGLLAWGDDGCSSYLFDIFTMQNKGKLVSVDIDETNVYHTNSKTSKRVEIYCSDSVEFLANFENPEDIDLLYLDSYDFDPNNPEPSQIHHLNELRAIYGRLKSGCMILIDDAGVVSKSANLGKAGKVFEFMSNVGVDPTIFDYQILWIKP
jgi:hypothetical protein